MRKLLVPKWVSTDLRNFIQLNSQEKKMQAPKWVHTDNLENRNLNRNQKIGTNNAKTDSA